MPGKSIFEHAVQRMREHGLAVTINDATGSALADLDGREGTYRLILRAEPSIDDTQRLVMQTVLSQSALEALDISRIVLLNWMNAKNSDLLFGRYYYYDGLLIFEIAIPVFDNGCDWNGFEYFLRLAVFSFEDTMAQLKAVSDELSK